MVFTGGASAVVVVFWALFFFYGVGAYISTYASFHIAARARVIASPPPLFAITKAVGAGFAIYMLCAIFTGGIGFWLFPIVNAVGLLLLRRYVWTGVSLTSRESRVFGLASLFTAQVLVSVVIAYGIWRSVLFLLLFPHTATAP